MVAGCIANRMPRADRAWFEERRSIYRASVRNSNDDPNFEPDTLRFGASTSTQPASRMHPTDQGKDGRRPRSRQTNGCLHFIAGCVGSICTTMHTADERTSRDVCDGERFEEHHHRSSRKKIRWFTAASDPNPSPIPTGIEGSTFGRREVGRSVRISDSPPNFEPDTRMRTGSLRQTKTADEGATSLIRRRETLRGTDV